MNRRSLRRLSLHRETLRRLDARALRHAAGGTRRPDDLAAPVATRSCPPDDLAIAATPTDTEAPILTGGVTAHGAGRACGG